MKAYIFPGQGSQHSGMGKDLYENNVFAKDLFEKANDLLGFRITEIMFSGTEDQLKQTKVTQPAIFLHSVILAKISENFAPNMVAGHSLGEFSALVAAQSLTFEDGLRLVNIRANAMQKACEKNPSTMAAILGLGDAKVAEICENLPEKAYLANYNCPGQLVISGSFQAVEKACEELKKAGAKRALLLPVGGAFHSPLMAQAEQELKEAIENTSFKTPICPIYQNIDAKPYTDIAQIRKNLLGQLTASVRWTQSVENMLADGATEFVECGAGKVLQGLVKKIDKNANVASL
ncbi:MAG: [acyl-carrier-protein] S-malonyltransferase [Bacteroidetes bacterium]|nr:MAG: [acyl-carrier-protein] S-malonyltransferase [Bacteroidota bacterium]